MGDDGFLTDEGHRRLVNAMLGYDGEWPWDEPGLAFLGDSRIDGRLQVGPAGIRFRADVGVPVVVPEGEQIMLCLSDGTPFYVGPVHVTAVLQAGQEVTLAADLRIE